MAELATKLELETELVQAFSAFEDFSKVMLDAFALIDPSGRVIKCSSLLSQLTGQKSKQITRAPSLDSLVTLTVGGRKISILELANRPDPTRHDEIKGEANGKELNLIIGAYPFFDRKNQFLGAFVLLRDVTAETNLQGKYKDAQSRSISDPLTGLFTRAYFEDYLNLQLSAFERVTPVDVTENALTIIMTDIDHFKKVNDVYGHQAGDHILKITAGVMLRTIRKTDIVCRYGGEEFLIILPGTSLEGGRIAAEKIRENLEKEEITFEGKKISITASLGVAQIKIGKEPYSETISRADGCLYKAKREGRNRVIVAE